MGMASDRALSVQSATGDVGGGAGAACLSRSDLQQIERAAARGCPITVEDRRKSIDCCRSIIENEKCPSRTPIAAVRALTALEAIDLRDVHHIERMQHESGILDLRMKRAESGKSNDCVAIQVTPVRELPLPEGLREMPKRIVDASS